MQSQLLVLNATTLKLDCSNDALPDDPRSIANTTFFIFVSAFVGGLIYHLLSLYRLKVEYFQVPYTIVMLILGFIFGLVVYEWNLVQLKNYTLLSTTAGVEVMKQIFLPILIFDSAYSLNMHIFLRCAKQIVILAAPALLFAFFLLAAILKVLPLEIGPNDDEWGWGPALLTSAILCPTDPVAVVQTLKATDASADLVTIMEGESLLNDGVAFIIFNIVIATLQGEHESLMDYIFMVARQSFGSLMFGLLMGMACHRFLRHIYKNRLSETAVPLCMTFISFYFAEHFLGVSGVMSVVCLGMVIKGNRNSISTHANGFLLQFFEMLTYLVNTVMFTIGGMLIARLVVQCNTTNNRSRVEVTGWCAVVYIVMTTARFIMMVISYPVLRLTGYGFPRHYVPIISWGGLRGAIALILALELNTHETLGATTSGVRGFIMFCVPVVVFLTLLVNANTITPLLYKLGVTTASLPKRIALASAVNRVKEEIAEGLIEIQADPVVADAKWDVVLQYVSLEDKTDLEDLRGKGRKTGVQSEVRERILQFMKTSTWQRYARGLLGSTALDRFLYILECAADTESKRVNTDEVIKSWEQGGLFPYFKALLEKLLIQTQDGPPAHKCRRCVFYIVQSAVFEWAINFITLANIGTVIWELVATADEIEESHEIVLFWVWSNRTFVLIYLVEAVLKLTALGGKYFKKVLNNVDFFVLVISLIDIVLAELLDSRSQLARAAQSLRVIRPVFRVFRILRLTRFLRITRLLTIWLNYKMQHIIAIKVYRGYQVGYTYLASVHDVLDTLEDFGTLKSLDSDNVIRDELLEEANRIAGELYKLECKYPSVIIAVKTRQTVNELISRALDKVGHLHEEGLLAEREADTLSQELEWKWKRAQGLSRHLEPLDIFSILVNQAWWPHGYDQTVYLREIVPEFHLKHHIAGETLYSPNMLVDGVRIFAGGISKFSEPSNVAQGRVAEKFLQPGEMIGLFDVLSKHKKASFTLITKTSCKFYYIDKEFLLKSLRPIIKRLKYLEIYNITKPTEKPLTGTLREAQFGITEPIGLLVRNSQRNSETLMAMASHPTTAVSRKQTVSRLKRQTVADILADLKLLKKKKSPKKLLKINHDSSRGRNANSTGGQVGAQDVSPLYRHKPSKSRVLSFLKSKKSKEKINKPSVTNDNRAGPVRNDVDLGTDEKDTESINWYLRNLEDYDINLYDYGNSSGRSIQRHFNL